MFPIDIATIVHVTEASFGLSSSLIPVSHLVIRSYPVLLPIFFQLCCQYAPVAFQTCFLMGSHNALLLHSVLYLCRVLQDLLHLSNLTFPVHLCITDY